MMSRRRTGRSQGDIRRADHAGSWYTNDGDELDAQLTSWLDAVKDTEDQAFPVQGCKAIISPHAGYAYSGPAAAYAYKSIDTRGIKRVFVLGPSHHKYINGCALSPARVCETPLGDLEVDLEVVEELQRTGEFEQVSIEDDEAEHSLEMQFPYVRKVFQGQDVKIVPIIVGSISQSSEKHYGEIIAPYLDREDTICVVSSDFCHWGTRFSYTFYYPTLPSPSASASAVQDQEQTYDSGISLSRSTSLQTYASPSAPPIWSSIETLDRQGMRVLTLDPTPSTSSKSESPTTPSPSAAHDAFSCYLKKTKNTICGRHPIGVLLGALTVLATQPRPRPSASYALPPNSGSNTLTSSESGTSTGTDDEQGGGEGGGGGGGDAAAVAGGADKRKKREVELKFVRYEQSSQCVTLRDSSVSYASAWVRF